MTASTTTSFRVVTTGDRRRVVTAPAARPDLRLPRVHPARPVAPGRMGAVSSCATSRPAVAAPSGLWLRLKVATVGLLALAGVAASASSFVAMTQPDPARGYVAGDPAWAHVDNP